MSVKTNIINNDKDNKTSTPPLDDLLNRANEFLERKKRFKCNSETNITQYVDNAFTSIKNGRSFYSYETRKRLTPEEQSTMSCDIQGCVGIIYNESYNFSGVVSNSSSSIESSSCVLTDGYMTTGSCRPH